MKNLKARNRNPLDLSRFNDVNRIELTDISFIRRICTFNTTGVFDPDGLYDVKINISFKNLNTCVVTPKGAMILWEYINGLNVFEVNNKYDDQHLRQDWFKVLNQSNRFLII